MAVNGYPRGCARFFIREKYRRSCVTSPRSRSRYLRPSEKSYYAYFALEGIDSPPHAILVLKHLSGGFVWVALQTLALEFRTTGASVRD